jgi:hypothetical protein
LVFGSYQAGADPIEGRRERQQLRLRQFLPAPMASNGQSWARRVSRGRNRAQSVRRMGALPRAAVAEMWRGLVGQDVFVVRCRVHVVAGFVGVCTRHCWRGRPGWPACAEARAGRRVVSDAQVARDLLDEPGVLNDGDDAHGVLANGAARRVHVPDAQDQVPPAFGGKSGCGGGETPGRRTTSSGGRPRWRTPCEMVSSEGGRPWHPVAVC